MTVILNSKGEASLLHWLNDNQGVAGWISGMGAFAAAATALWIARWQNAQLVKRADHEGKTREAQRRSELALRRWLLALMLRPALSYVHARAVGTREGANKLREVQDRRSILPKKVDDRALIVLKIKLPDDLTDHLNEFFIFGPELGGGLGELVAHSRLLNGVIDAGLEFDRHPEGDELIKRADALLQVLSVVQPGIEAIIKERKPTH